MVSDDIAIQPTVISYSD